MRVHHSIAAAAAAATAALAVAGCGIGGGGDESPATIAPADASLYVEGVVRPEGEQKENLDKFLSVMLDTDDPGQEITELINDEFSAEGEERSFEEDVDPWLGDEAGVFTVGYANNPPALVVAQAEDTEQGVELLESGSKRLTEREYNGLTYSLDEQDQAIGAIDDFVVLGDEEAYKAAVDASEEEDASLADAEHFKDATKDLPEDSLGTAYIDVKGLIGEAAQERGIPAGAVKDAVGKLGIGNALVASAAAGDENISVDLGGIERKQSEPPRLLGQLPEDAWFAVGIGDVGGKLSEAVKDIESAGIPGLGEGTIAALLSTQAGLDLEDDLTSWVGDVAVFVRGSDPAALDGALVVETTDDAAAARSLDQLRQSIGGVAGGSPQPLDLGIGGNGFRLTTPSAPQDLLFVQQSGLFVIGLGEAATAAALTPSGRLSDSPRFGAATGALGTSGPAFYLSIPAALEVLANDPELGADFKRIRPYLERLAYLTAGGGDGGLQIVLGAGEFKDPEPSIETTETGGVETTDSEETETESTETGSTEFSP